MPPKTLTKYGQRFGESTNYLFKDTGKSGLTPILFQDEKATQTTNNFKYHERYQRANLRTFATWELEESGCVSKADAIPSGLEVPIHEVMVKKRWLRSNIDIGGGLPGKWEAENKIVWRALELILRLATRMLISSPMWLWFDALIHDQWEKLPMSQFDDDGEERDLYAFRARPPEVAANETFKIDEVFDEMVGKVRFELRDSTDRGRQGRQKVNAYTKAASSSADPKAVRNSKIALSCELVAPLLKQDLTVAEVVMQQWFIAKVLVHELTHAAVRYVRFQGTPNLPTPVLPVPPEPFFEDEEINECGRSAENAIWGGIVMEAWSLSNGLDHKKIDSWHILGACVQNWVNYKSFATGKVATANQRTRLRFSENFQENSIASFWPVPVSFMENMQQEEFWTTNLTKFGVDAFKPDRIFGHLLLRGATWQTKNDTNVITLGPQYDDWVTKSGQKVSTLGEREYKTIDDVRYGRLIPADKNFRPIIDQTEEDAREIIEALKRGRKRSSSGSQAGSPVKRRQGGVGSGSGSSNGSSSSSGTASPTWSAGAASPIRS